MSDHILRARTVLSKNGKRINWTRVPYFVFEDTPEHFIANVKWKYKAGIQTEEVHVKKDEGFRAVNYFKRYGLVPFGNDVYLNIHNVLMIEETQIPGPQDKVLVKITLVDGFQVVRKLLHQDWVYWKTTYG